MLGSISRVAPAVATAEQLRAGGVVRELLSAWRDAKDLIEIDAYVPGTNAVVDRAVVLQADHRCLLPQPMDGCSDLDSTRRMLVEIVEEPATP